jgi:hypothetical protein
MLAMLVIMGKGAHWAIKLQQMEFQELLERGFCDAVLPKCIAET